MKMRKHRIKGVEYVIPRIFPGVSLRFRVIAGNGYHRKTFDSEAY